MQFYTITKAQAVLSDLLFDRGIQILQGTNKKSLLMKQLNG